MTDLEVEAINSVRVEATEAFKSGDYERFLTFFTDDAVWMPEGEPPVVGKEAWREWGEFFAESNRPVFVTESQEVVAAGNWGFDRFTLTLVAESKETGESFEGSLQGLWILRKQDDGSWKIARYIWNSN